MFALYFLLLAALALAQRTGTRLINGLQDQRPPVARVNQAWSFPILSNTFRSTSNSALTFSAAGLPGWATFDATSLSFAGTPTSSDVGNTFVTLTASAADGSSGQDGFFLLVSSDQPPTVQLAVAEQLHNSSTLPQGCILHYNGAIRVPPRWSFSIGLQQYTFASSTGSPVYYTAYETNSTRLPSWLEFANTTVTFSGVAPSSGQYYITLFGSDHYGYGDVVQEFIIQVDAHSFDMLSGLPALNATLGAAINYTIPISSFEIDDIPVLPANITMTPDLSNFPTLSWSAANETISGVIPSSTVGNASIPITFYSSYGQQLQSNITVAILPALFSAAALPTIYVKPGQDFSSDLSGYLGSTTAQVSPTFSPSNASNWIHVGSQPLVLNGTAPDDVASYGNVTISLTAQDPATGATGSSSVLVALDSPIPASASPNMPIAGTLHDQGSGGLTTKGKIALAVVLGVASAIALLVALLCCCRRHRKAKQEKHAQAVVLANKAYSEKNLAAATSYSKAQEKSKTRAALSDENLDNLAAIYTGKKAGSNATMPQSPSAVASLASSKPKRFDMFRMLRRTSDSTQSGMTNVYSNSNLRGADISRPVHNSASHDVVIVEEEEGNTYIADDGSDDSHELNTSSWGSKASSSLFYSDDGTPTGPSVNNTPRSAPRQRREFMRAPPDASTSNAPLPSPIPFPVPAALRLIQSESQSSNLASDSSSILSRTDPLQPAAIARASLQHVRGSDSREYNFLNSSVSTATPRLIPFKNERIVSNPKDSSTYPQSPETADAPDQYSRDSVLYAPPDNDEQARSPIFFSTPNSYESPILSSSTHSTATTGIFPSAIDPAPAIRVVKNSQSTATPVSKSNRYVGGTAAAQNSPIRTHNRTNTSSSMIDQVRVPVAVGEPFHFT